MKILGTTFLLFIFLWSSSLAAEYCKVDDFDNSTSCILVVNTGGLREPRIMFASEGSDWQLAVYMVFEDWARLDGDSKIKIDEGEILTLKHVTTSRDVISGDTLTEVAIYRTSEDLLQAIAKAKEVVWFRLSAAKTTDQDLKIAASKFSELGAFITEAKALQ